jgi:hypothetical protein
MKVKQVGKVEIFVTSDGKFYATLNDKTYTRSSLNSLVKLISDTEKPLKVMLPEFRWGTPSCDIDNIVSTNGDRLKGVKLYHRYDEIYVYDSEAEHEFSKIRLDYQALHERWNRIVKKLIVVNSGNFEKLRNEKE